MKLKHTAKRGRSANTTLCKLLLNVQKQFSI
jgi:hypothetical protein